MQILPAQTATAQQPGLTAGQALTVLSGELSKLPAGQVLQGNIKAILQSEALVELANGVDVRIKALPGMTVNQPIAIQVRLNAAGQPQLELARSLPTVPGPTTAPLPSITTGPTTAPLPSTATGPAVNWQPGQVLPAQVLSDLGANRVLLQLNHTLVEAKLSQPLPIGVPLQMQVRQTQPEVQLAVVDLSRSGYVAASPQTAETAVRGPLTAAATATRPAEVTVQVPPTPLMSVEQLAAALRQRLQAIPLGEVIRNVIAQTVTSQTQSSSTPPPQPPPPALEALVSRLRALLPQGQPPTAEQLGTFLRDGGLHFEARLAKHAVNHSPPSEIQQTVQRDVKGLVLRALAEASVQPSEAARTAPVVQHLQAIEAQQTGNLLALARGDPVFFQVPLMLTPDQSSTLHLAVQRDGKGPNAENQGVSFFMHLELEQFGTVRVDAQFNPMGMRVIFYVEKEQGRARLHSGLSELREALQQGREGPVLLAVRPLGELPRDQKPLFEALASGLPASGTHLDVRV